MPYKNIKKYQQVLQLWETNKNKSKIAQITKLDRGTVRKIINNYGTVAQLEEAIGLSPIKYEFESHQSYKKSYAYILGIYLGDGYINKTLRTWKLRIFQDKKYINVVKEIEENLKIIFPYNRTNKISHGKNCYEIYIYNNNIIELFPQHDKGKKYKRKIKLETWQEEIINEFPFLFIKGLIHSDGCSYISKSNKKEYLNYGFCNKSFDIINLLINSLNKVNISYNLYFNKNKEIYRLSIVKRKSVNFLYKKIGIKE